MSGHCPEIDMIRGDQGNVYGETFPVYIKYYRESEEDEWIFL